jgi:hypothetical protein
MGKAEIISGGGAGSYTVQILYDKTTLNRNIALVNSAITKADGLIADLEIELAEKQTEYNDAMDALDQQIPCFRQHGRSITLNRLLI